MDAITTKALREIKREIDALRITAAKIVGVSNSKPDTPIGEILEDGHIAQVQIHNDNIESWVDALLDI